MTPRLSRLKHAVTVEHNCRADHSGARVIVERGPDGGVWRGKVEVFDLSGHPQADRCYAWTEKVARKTVCTTILRIPPVKSAQTAVRAILARRHRRAES